MLHKMFLLISIIVLMAGASCAGPEPKADFANEQVCQDLALFITSVDALQDESAYSDPNAISAQFAVVRTNFNSLVASVGNLEVAEKEDFQSAVEDLLETADSLPEDNSVTDSLAALQEPIKDVLAAAENLQTGLQCKDNMPNP